MAGERVHGARKVVIDTDPGLDDAVAILYALAEPAFEVLGVTTVAGNIGLDHTTRNAGGLLAAAGREDIPVIAGADRPLSGRQLRATDIHGADGMGGVHLPRPARAPLTGAAEWLARLLREAAPGSIDILALGPLTNIAQLASDAPDSLRGIGRIIAMGGALDEPGNVGPRAEFNLAADPRAAAQVLALSVPVVLVPLDVTRRVRASHEDAARLRSASNPGARISGAAIEAYFTATEGRESRPLHDPCVMLLARFPELFRLEARHLDVVKEGVDAGALIDGALEVTVAASVDGATALGFLLDTLFAGDRE